MQSEYSRKKQIAGLLYGLAAGLAFSIFAWGLDAVQLAFANGAYFWVKFVPGLVVCLLAGGLTGWLTCRFQNMLFNVVLWIGLALLFSRLMFWLSVRFTPKIVGLFDGAMGSYLKYPHHKSLDQNYWFGFASIVVVAIICGMLENILIDQALFSSGKFSLIIPLVICMMSFSLVGGAADALANKQFRSSLLKVNALLQFAVENADKDVPVEVARKMRLGALNTIEGYLSRDRKLILSNFDDAMGQIDILVDFDGRWVKCTTIYDQITMCKPALITPWNILSMTGWMVNLSVDPGFQD